MPLIYEINIILLLAEWPAFGELWRPMPSATMSLSRWFQLGGLNQLEGPTIKLWVARSNQLPTDTKMHLLSG